MASRKRAARPSGQSGSIGNRVFRFLASPAVIVGLLLLIFAFHVLAIVFAWYELPYRLDKVHHFFAGFWIASVSFFSLARRPHLIDLTRAHGLAVLFALGMAALAGVSWELYEAGFDLLFPGRGFFVWGTPGLTDTLGDLIADLSGGLVGALILGMTARRAR